MTREQIRLPFLPPSAARAAHLVIYFLNPGMVEKQQVTQEVRGHSFGGAGPTRKSVVALTLAVVRGL